eukprot:1181097-Prorocentrum_minimum.AAC.5
MAVTRDSLPSRPLLRVLVSDTTLLRFDFGIVEIYYVLCAAACLKSVLGESEPLDKAVRKGEGERRVPSAPLPLLAQEDPPSFASNGKGAHNTPVRNHNIVHGRWCYMDNITSFYKSSSANNGKGALNSPDGVIRIYGVVQQSVNGDNGTGIAELRIGR